MRLNRRTKNISLVPNPVFPPNYLSKTNPVYPDASHVGRFTVCAVLVNEATQSFSWVAKGTSMRF